MIINFPGLLELGLKRLGLEANDIGHVLYAVSQCW